MKLSENFFHHDAQGFFLPDSHSGINVENIGHKQNTLIEGIRGTGKTHILKMIHRNRLEKFNSNRVLPVYLSIAKISEHAKKDPDTFRMYLYGNLVREAVSIANINRDNFQPNKTLLDKSLRSIKSMFGLDSEEPIDKILEQINSLSEKLFEEFEFGILGKYINSENEQNLSTSKGGQANANMSLGGNIIGATLTENRAEFSAEKNQAGIAYLGKQLSQNDAVDFLVTFLKQLQVILDLDYTLLLIDECSEAPKDAQIEIFRLLKTIRGADSLLPETGSASAYFVSTVYPKSHTYYPTIKSDGFNFEPGHDFTTNYLQWDITDTNGYEQFFKDMLINRAKSLSGYSGTIDEFIKDFFDKEDTFLLAIYSAHGIPRRFWEILKRAYNNGNGKIKYTNLSNIILGIAQEQLIDHNLLTELDQDFIQYQAHRLNGQNAEIRRKNRKHRRQKPQNIFFEISRSNSNNIQSIIMVGGMHDMKRVRTKNNMGIAKPLYALDISIVFALKAIPEGEFIQFIKNDLHRNVSTNFEKALTILAKHFTESFHGDMDDSYETFDDGGLEAVTEDTIIKDEYYGTVKNMSEYASVILPDDEEQEAIFQSNNINEHDREYIRVGDRVVFYSSWLEGTRIATNISKINVIQSEGTVSKIFENIFGRITILEDGTEVLFLLKDIEEEVVEGDLVEFSLEETKTDKRKAYNIKKKEESYGAVLSKEMKVEISRYVVAYMKEEKRSISLALMASRIINKFGDIVKHSQWFGYKKFINLLEALEIENICISKAPPPGYMSECFNNKIDEGNVAIVNKDIDSHVLPDKNELIIKLSKEVGIPKLDSDEYDKVFDFLVEIINKDNYVFNQTAKTLRDVSQENDIPLNRLGSNFILRGITYAGHWFGKPEEKEKLKKAFLKNINNLINEHNIIISDKEKVFLESLFG